MKRLLLFTVIVLFRNFLFAQQQQMSDTSILRIDPSSAMGGNCSKIFDSIIYVPLENSKQCLIDEISRLEVVDKYFIVLDGGLDQIVIFNRDGSFHAKCANIKGFRKNPNTRRNIFRDFSINQYKDQIVVRNGLDPENLYLFNYNGDAVGSISLKDIGNFKGLNGLAYLDSNTCVYAISSIFANPDTSKYKPYELFIANKNSSSIIGVIPYDPNGIANAKWMDIQIVLSGPLYQSGRKGVCFFTRAYDYNIYEINSRGVSNVFKIVLPIDFSLPVDFLVKEEKYRGKRLEYLANNREKVFVISNVYMLEDNLLFTLNSRLYPNTNKIFLYNLKRHSLFNLLRISPDSSSFFLPMISDQYSIQACDGKNIYSSVSSLQMFNYFEATRDKHLNFPIDLQKYLVTQNRESNPVIIQLKLKNKF
ncbi:6-bladed beta-propeller [Chitinophaga vietnamensis]|uniref:6-bladed beta-propeller n=1 Tax=Chitinophaga vietnamensis TaxID=2593957 RepID=UPI001375BA22|nr:6-bladed beta-propeller [Chitinophaga vietnamensis]